MLTFDAAPDELQLFLQEAEEQLQLLDQDIVLLEKEGTRPELLQEIFRAAHTLKGSSAAIGHAKMARLTHAMENVLDQLRQGRTQCGTETVDVLLQSLDALRLLKEEVVTFQDCGFDPVELIDALDAMSAAPDQRAAVPATVEVDQDAVASSSGEGEILITVGIAEDSPLPAARALQAYLEAARFGQVLRSKPSLDSIENQDVGARLEIVLQIEGDAAELQRAIEDLPDIVKVQVKSRSQADGGEALVSSQPSEDPVAQNGTPDAPGSERAGAGSVESNGKRGSALGKTVRLDVSRLDDLMNLVGELVIDRTRLAQLGGQLQSRYDDDCVRDLTETSQHIARIVDELQESIMKARMLPVESLFNRFPRVVRDLSQRFGKKVDFVVEGKETELDRSVIEELLDPLVHLLRNSVDHGIENPEVRVAAGKPEVGRVNLSAVHRENRILIRVEDDGAGINPAKVRAKALERGIINAEMAERMSDQDAVELVFAPGFSTAEVVSDVSGRGVGMDIVRTNIEKLNGRISVESWPGKGSRFTLELPLTLAIIDALMVGLGSEVLAIPLVSVVETLRVKRDEIQWVNRRQVIQLRDSVLPLLPLDRALGFTPTGEGAERVFVVAVKVGEHRMGLVVDSLLGELQVVIKSLGRQVGNIAGVTGATILGDGRVALILDVPSLIKVVLDEQSKVWAA